MKQVSLSLAVRICAVKLIFKGRFKIMTVSNQEGRKVDKSIS